MKAALISPDKDKWLKAMEGDYKQHQFEHTWDPVTSPAPGAPFIPTHMVLVRKTSADGTINKYKARLVAGGQKTRKFTIQHYYKSQAIKILFSIAAKTNQKVQIYDVKSAYLKSYIDTDIYIYDAYTQR